MKTNITELMVYLNHLIELEATKENKMGRVELETVLHTKSEKIGAASAELKLKVYENEKSEFPLDFINTTLMVVDKSSLNPKTKQPEFVRTCSVVMDDRNHDIVWTKTSKESPKAAVEYCVGYMIINAMLARKLRPMKNVSGYIRSLAEEISQNEKKAEATQENK